MALGKDSKGLAKFPGMARLLVFDLDGTLADTRLDLAEAVNAALGAQGLPALPVESVAAAVGHGARQLLRSCLEKALRAGPQDSAAERPGGKDGAASPLEDALLEHFLAFYGAHCTARTSLYPGVRETLEVLARDFREPGALRMAVLTNKPLAPAQKILAALGIAPFFDAVLGGDNPFGKKPDPAALLHLMDRYGASPDHTILVGDGLPDLEVIRRAGGHFIPVFFGIGSPELRRHTGPLPGLACFSDLPGLLPALSSWRPGPGAPAAPAPARSS